MVFVRKDERERTVKSHVLIVVTVSTTKFEMHRCYAGRLMHSDQCTACPAHVHHLAYQAAISSGLAFKYIISPAPPVPSSFFFILVHGFYAYQ
jgi:hypothetical protein